MEFFHQINQLDLFKYWKHFPIEKSSSVINIRYITHSFKFQKIKKMENLLTDRLTEANVLQNLTSIPQDFAIVGENLYVNVHGPIDPLRVYRGMTVFNRANPNSIAFASVPHAIADVEDPTQELIATINSNNGGPHSRKFTFKLPPAGMESRANQLFLQVDPLTPELLAYGKSGDLISSGDFANLIPIVVGPGSISVAEPFTEAEKEILGFTEVSDIDWGKLLRGVVAALPTIARHGLEIYEELKRNATPGNNAAGPESLLSIIGAVGKVALPFVGGLLKKVFN